MITTERLVLRGCTPADGPAIRRLAGAREVAYNTLLIPHPYPEGEAERWIATHEEQKAKGNHLFAIALGDGGDLIGTIGLHANGQHDHGEIGYWIGVPYWGKGFATEAAAAVVQYGFDTLGLHRIFASCFSRNPASGRVLQKIGMRHEGSLRQHFKKWDEYVDVECYAILRSEYEARQGKAGARVR